MILITWMPISEDRRNSRGGSFEFMKWNQMKRKTLILVGLALTTASCFSADHPKATITNGLVRTNVYLPNAKTGYYRGTRFDWSGVVSNLEYAGHNYYPEWFQHMDPKVRDFAYDGAAIVAGPCPARSEVRRGGSGCASRRA